MIKTTDKQATILALEEESIAEILGFIEEHQNTLYQSHLIITIPNNISESISDLMSFLPIAQMYRQELRKSFVLVCDVIATEKLEELEDELNITPSLQEAHDIVEMEEIERDLGF